VVEEDAWSVERWRKAAYQLPVVAAGLAIVLSIAMGVSWDLDDCLTAILIAGPPLGLGLFLSRHGKVPAFAGVLTIFALTLWLTLIGAGLALLGTRSPVPVADPWLAAVEHILPLTAMEIVRAVNFWPGWAISALYKVYSQTGSYLFFTLVALYLTDRGAVAWRMFMIWGTSFLLISLLAFLAPALGCYSQLSAEEVRQLPAGAGRYAVRAFTEFRYAAEPMIAFKHISGVITFPSFHTVCALMIAQAWHGTRFAGPLTKLLTAAIIFSCVPIGGHYLVDLAAGAAIWWGTTLAVDRIGKPRTAAGPGPAIVAAAA
jgi:hypothetical protein